MNVVQVCIGRLHHFDLARQLSKRGMLGRFYTGYPPSKLKGQAIPMDRVTSFPWIVTPYMAFIKWCLLIESWDQSLWWLAQESLDAFVARHLPGCDILLALSGSGLKAAAVARQRGAKFVCDRGSTHIRFQDAILREEFARWGDHFSGVDPRVVDKEEKEYEAADIITVPSEFALRSFLDMGVRPEKLRKVPYGVDLRRFDQAGDPAKDRFDVLFVGQVGFRKGVPDLLRAFASLRHPRKRLRIVGGLQPEMRRYLAHHPPGPDVELVGLLPQAKLKEVMSRAHVMVLPSIEEGLALVQAQALACGCPVIGTWNAGAADLFTDGVEGFIVPPRNPAAIVERLQWLADEPEKRQQMSEDALKRVAALGGWDDYGQRIAAVLSELVTPPVTLAEAKREEAQGGRRIASRT